MWIYLSDLVVLYDMLIIGYSPLSFLLSRRLSYTDAIYILFLLIFLFILNSKFISFSPSSQGY